MLINFGRDVKKAKTNMGFMLTNVFLFIFNNVYNRKYYLEQKQMFTLKGIFLVINMVPRKTQKPSTVFSKTWRVGDVELSWSSTMMQTVYDWSRAECATQSLTSSMRKSLTSCSKQLSLHFLVKLSHFSFGNTQRHDCMTKVLMTILRLLPPPQRCTGGCCHWRAWSEWCWSPESQRSPRSPCHRWAPCRSGLNDQTSYSSSQSTDCTELW